MSPVVSSSQTQVFRYLSKHVFRGRYFRKCKSYEGHFFFLKWWKFNGDSKNAEKNSEKMFGFSDNCIRIVSIHLSLLIRDYLSSVVNVLRKGLKNFHVSKSDFCNSITFTVITQDDKGALIKTESVFRPVYYVACRGVLSKGSV